MRVSYIEIKMTLRNRNRHNVLCLTSKLAGLLHNALVRAKDESGSAYLPPLTRNRLAQHVNQWGKRKLGKLKGGENHQP